MTDYYNLTLDDGISGDDVNRHLREKNLGFKAPSADWANCKDEIRCIYPGQTVTRGTLDEGANIFIHRLPAYFNPSNILDEPVPIF